MATKFNKEIWLSYANTGVIPEKIENKEIIIKEEVIEEPISEEATVSVENAAEEAPAVSTETTVVEEVTDTVKEENVETVKEENK